jgi:hypothetical protein
MMPLEIASPSPVPWVLVEKLGSNSFCELVAEIPTPVSVKLASTNPTSLAKYEPRLLALTP